MAEGQLVGHGVLPITALRGLGGGGGIWTVGDCDPLPRAGGDPYAHWGVGVGQHTVGDDDNDDNRSAIRRDSECSKGKGVGRPRKAKGTSPTLPGLPAVPELLPKWRMGCSNGSWQWWCRGRCCSCWGRCSTPSRMPSGPVTRRRQGGTTCARR